MTFWGWTLPSGGQKNILVNSIRVISSIKQTFLEYQIGLPPCMLSVQEHNRWIACMDNISFFFMHPRVERFVLQLFFLASRKCGLNTIERQNKVVACSDNHSQPKQWSCRVIFVATFCRKLFYGGKQQNIHRGCARFLCKWAGNATPRCTCNWTRWLLWWTKTRRGVPSLCQQVPRTH